jgi:hypothetical protein
MSYSVKFTGWGAWSEGRRGCDYRGWGQAELKGWKLPTLSGALLA